MRPLQAPDWRITRAVARRLVQQQDASRRERMPIFRDRPPLTVEDIEAATTGLSARNAFWDDSTPRSLDDAIAGASRGQIITYCVRSSHADICNGGFHQY